jgi:hypothetical protein
MMNNMISQSRDEFLEEKIPVAAYSSSQALKDEILKIIHSRAAGNWDFVRLNSEGPFLFVVFKNRQN